MAKTVRRYNTSNLTYGGRTLRVESNMPKIGKVTTDLVKVVQNFDRSIRSEVLNDASVMLVKRAKYYLQQGKIDASTPNPADNSHFLERDLSDYVVFEDVDKVVVDLSSIPYAAIHNKPLGSFTKIGENKKMVFYWYRKARWVSTYAGVKKPGLAFLDRAVDDVAHELPRLMRKYIDLYRNSGDLAISPKTGGRLRGPAKSPSARRDARMGR